MLNRFYVGVGNQSESELSAKHLSTLDLAATFFGGATLLPKARGVWLDGNRLDVEDVDIYEILTPADTVDTDDPYLKRFHSYLKVQFAQKEVLWVALPGQRVA